MMYFMESIPSVIKQGFSKLNESAVDTSEAINGYNMLLIITTVFFLLCASLAIYNPDGFDKTLGYGLFITLIMILIVVYLLKRFTKFNPTAGQSIQYINLFQYIKDYSKIIIDGLVMTFGKWETITIGIIIISLFIGLLASFGLLTNNIPSNNSPMLFNYFLILFITGISVFLFTKARSTVDPVSTAINLTPVSKIAYEEKIKYTVIFILFIIGIIGLYLWNPYEIMSKYGGAGALFFLIFIGLALFSMIKLNDYFFNNPDKQAEYKDIPGILSFFKVIYVFFALTVSGLLLWGFLSVIGMFNNSGTSHGIGHTIINLILLISMLGILYKLVNAGGFLERNPYFRLTLNTLLYIPCLLVVVTDYLSKIFFGSNIDVNGININSNSTSILKSKNDFAFLIIAVFACVLYIFMTTMAVPIVKQQVYSVGGETIVKTPIPIGQKNDLASFRALNGLTGINYTYAISFWFYIDSFPPSTNNSYTKSVSIVSYGDQLHVKYYSPTNTLYVTVKEDPANVNEANIREVHDLEKTITADNIADWESIKTSITNKINEIKGYKGQYELDESNDRIVFKKTNVLLQKWNNIVLNYSSGTLDVFFNGELVKTAINVVNHNTPGAVINDILSVGTENGISGSVCNMTYYKTPIDLITINKLYELFKENNPPLA
jgi:hypothetical protein